MDQLISALENTLTADQTRLNESLHYIKTLCEENYSWLVMALTSIMSDNLAISGGVRQQAALQLKNVIKHRGGCWSTLPCREEVKWSLLRLLTGEQGGPRGLSQCIHAVAELELVVDGWPDLVPALVHTATAAASNNKIVSLECIGYICESVPAEKVELHVNSLLTAIVQCVVKQDVLVAQTALRGLYSALEFAAFNFARTNERNYLMQVICESTQHQDPEVVVISIQCLCRVISLYYPLMEDYLVPAIWPISFQAVSSPHTPIRLQGLEVWNCLSECELDLAEDGDQSTGWITPALSQIIPPLIQVLIDDTETCEGGGGGQVAARLLARATANHILPHVLPFLHQNLVSPEEKLQAGALACLAAVLDGPDQSQLLPLILALADILDSVLRSESAKVRVSGAGALSQLCQLHPAALADTGRLPALLGSLVLGLGSTDVLVAEHCCRALTGLLEEGKGVLWDGKGVLEDAFVPCLQAIVSITDPACNQANVMSAGYESLASMLAHWPAGQVQASPQGLLQATPQDLLDLLLSRIRLINQTRGTQAGSQMYLFASLELVLGLVDLTDLLPQLEHILLLLASLLNKTSEVVEETLNCLGRLVEMTGTHVNKYSSDIMQKLTELLVEPESDGVCAGVVGLAGDLCRACILHSNQGGGDRINYTLSNGSLERPQGIRGLCRSCPLGVSGLIPLVLKLLQDPQRSRDLKPACFGALSDLLPCAGEQALVYLEPILHVVGEAGAAVLEVVGTDPEFAEELAVSIIDMLSTMLQLHTTLPALNNQLRNSLNRVYLNNVLVFLKRCDEWMGGREELDRSACGLIADIGHFIRGPLENVWVEDFLERNCGSASSKVCNVARLARDKIRSGGMDGGGGMGMNDSGVIMDSGAVMDNGAAGFDSSGGGMECSVYTRVTLSCSGQYITQNIEDESVTLSLGGSSGLGGTKTSGRASTFNASDVNSFQVQSSHTEVTVRLPGPDRTQTMPEVVYRAASPLVLPGTDTAQLRRLRKKRVAVVSQGEQSKKSRDADDFGF